MVTQKRVLCYTYGKRQINISVDDPRVSELQVALPKAETLSIAFESAWNRLYLTDLYHDVMAPGDIVRINLDGSDYTVILTGQSGASAIAIPPPGDYVPASSAWGVAVLALIVLSSSLLFTRGRRAQ